MIKVLLIVFVFSSSLVANHITHKKVMIAYAEEWPPYSYRDEQGKMRGILVDLLDTLLSEMLDLDVIHSGFPWKRAQVLAEVGTYDAVITFPSQKRKAKYLVTQENLIDLEWRGFTSVYSKKFDLTMKTKNPMSLKDELVFCSVLGDGTTEKLYEEQGIVSHKSKNVDIALKVLLEGRTDFFVNAKLTALNLILKNKIGNAILMHSKVYKKVPFHFLLSHTSDINNALIAKIDELVKKLKKEGKYQKLLQQIQSKEFDQWLMKEKKE